MRLSQMRLSKLRLSQVRVRKMMRAAQNAKARLKAMSDYLAAQKAISLSYDTVFEVVTNEHQKLQIATSGTMLLNRPDKIRASRKSGFSDTETVFDGKTLSILGKGQNAYVQAEVPGTIDTSDRPVAGQVPKAAPRCRSAAAKCLR